MKLPANIAAVSAAPVSTGARTRALLCAWAADPATGTLISTWTAPGSQSARPAGASLRRAA